MKCNLFTVQVDHTALFIRVPSFYEVSGNLMKDVSSAAQCTPPHFPPPHTHPLGACDFGLWQLKLYKPLAPCLRPRCALKTSRSTCKQRLHANITAPLLIRAVLQLHYVPGINIQRASAAFFCDNSTRPQCFLAVLWPLIIWFTAFVTLPRGTLL